MITKQDDCHDLCTYNHYAVGLTTQYESGQLLRVKITGKTDWSAGGHSDNVYLNSWTMYTRFPYNVPKNGGWGDETGDCASAGSVKKGGGPLGEGNQMMSWISLDDAVVSSSSRMRS